MNAIFIYIWIRIPKPHIRRLRFAAYMFVDNMSLFTYGVSDLPHICLLTTCLCLCKMTVFINARRAVVVLPIL